MAKLQIKYGLNIFSGGLLGAIMFHQHGAENGMLINNRISVFYYQDHWSVRHSTQYNIPGRMLQLIAREACGLYHFKTKIIKGNDRRLIYNLYTKE